MNLQRMRWGVRAALGLGVAASVAANILHARPNPISQVIAAWPPLALLLTVELISRIPVHRHWLAAVRMAATSTIAGIAAWVSYWHMAGVASRYGETGAAPYLLPLSVDGLVVVASVSLVELAGRIRAVDDDLAIGEEVVDGPPVDEPPPARRRREPATDAVKEQARAAYRESVAAGEPLSGAALGSLFGYSEQWGRQRIGEVKKEPRRRRLTAVNQ